MNFLTKNAGVIALVAIVIAIGGYYYPTVAQRLGTVSTSCNSFTTCLSDLYIASTWGGTGALQTTGTITSGGLVTTDAGQLHSYTSATTTSLSITLKASDITAYDTVIDTPIVGSITLTLPASSTMATWLPAAGDTQRTCFVNGTTTAGVYLTFAGGTGTTLLVASSSATALGSLAIGPQKTGCFNFVRGNATATTFDILSSFTAYQ